MIFSSDEVFKISFELISLIKRIAYLCFLLFCLSLVFLCYRKENIIFPSERTDW